MPTYDYQCESCGPFEKIRRIAERNEPAACPLCGEEAPRVMISAPNFADMPSDKRLAMATNEKACHEPKSSASVRHPKGCGCCKTSTTASPASSGAATARSFANRRPWMISH